MGESTGYELGQLDVTRKPGAEEFHLVSQHIVVGQIQEFILIRHKWNRQQLHIGIFRDSVRLSIITAAAGSDYVGPGVRATPGKWIDVVTG